MSNLGAFSGIPRDALATIFGTDGKATTTFARTNLPRVGMYDSASDSGNVALTTQIMTSVPILLQAGDVVTNLSFRSGATAAGTPTNWWFALYSNAATPALLAQTADQTSTAWAASTTKTVALSAAQTIRTTGIYWAAIMVKATTVPTLVGSGVAPAIATGETSLAQNSGSALTATAPATIASPTAQLFAPYCLIT